MLAQGFVTGHDLDWVQRYDIVHILMINYCYFEVAN